MKVVSPNCTLWEHYDVILLFGFNGWMQVFEGLYENSSSTKVHSGILEKIIQITGHIQFGEAHLVCGVSE